MLVLSPSSSRLLRLVKAIFCLFVFFASSPLERDFSTNSPHTSCLFSLSHTEHNKQRKPHIIYPNNETLTMEALIARLPLYIARTESEQSDIGGEDFSSLSEGISTSTIISVFRIPDNWGLIINWRTVCVAFRIELQSSWRLNALRFHASAVFRLY